MPELKNGLPNMTLRSYSLQGNDAQAVYGTEDNAWFGKIYSAYRGGCLYCAEIVVWERETGKSKRIPSTMGIPSEESACRETMLRYIGSLCVKFLA